MIRKYFFTILVFHTATISFSQKPPATCACALNNIIATGNISFVKIKKYSSTLTTYNYKADILFTNNTNCKMEIKSAIIDDKTTFLNLTVNNIGEKKRSWNKNVTHTKPFVVKDGKAKVLFDYKLNGIHCKQYLDIEMAQP